MKKLSILFMIVLLCFSMVACGNKNSVTQKCEKCKNEISIEDKFCPECGAEVMKTTEKDKYNDETTSSYDASDSKKEDKEHKHKWTEVYDVVYHEAKGHYETVVVSKAWDEKVLVKEAWDEKVIDQEYIEPKLFSKVECSRGHASSHWNINKRCHCGSLIYEKTWHEGGQEEISHIVHHEAEYKTVHHDAVTEQKWVVDQNAYEEKTLIGYKCDTCGESKDK